MMYMIGIDLGGTKIESVLFDKNFNELERVRVETQQHDGYSAILKRIKEACKKLTKGEDLSTCTIGVGTPGSIGRANGTIRYSNIQCVNGKRLNRDLTELLGQAVVIENDANCFALAEALEGAGKERKTVFGMVLGTGCGGGLVINNDLIQGVNGIAGEWGHSVFDPLGPNCYCGRKGCVERYLSGSALENRYAQITKRRVSLVEIVAAAESDEIEAREVISCFLDVFSRATANIISVLDPDVIVIGGGLSHISALYDHAVPKICDWIMGGSVNTEIVQNVLGADSGVIGAAILGARRRVK